MTDSNASVLAFCREFATAYHEAGEPESINNFSDTAPGWPIELLPEWAQNATVSIGVYPEVVVEAERLFPGEHATVSILQATFVNVEGDRSGEPQPAEVVVEIDPVDERHSMGTFSPQAALEAAELLSTARAYIEQVIA